MQVGMTKDQGVYNKPLAEVHPGALAAGTLLHTYICRQIVLFVKSTLQAYLCLNNLSCEDLFLYYLTITLKH